MAVGDFPRDPNVTVGQRGKGSHPWLSSGGPPPPGHPRRCQSKARSHPGQCGRWALTGRDYCAIHGGRARKAHRLKGFYTRQAKGTFKALMEELAARGDERADLSEEVDAARVIASQATKMLAAAIEVESEIKVETLVATADFAQRALAMVSELVAKMVKVQTMDRGTLDAGQVDHILTQVAEIVGNRIECERTKDQILKDLKGIRLLDKEVFIVNVS